MRFLTFSHKCGYVCECVHSLYSSFGLMGYAGDRLDEFPPVRISLLYLNNSALVSIWYLSIKEETNLKLRSFRESRKNTETTEPKEWNSDNPSLWKNRREIPYFYEVQLTSDCTKKIILCQSRNKVCLIEFFLGYRLEMCLRVPWLKINAI